MKMSTIGRPPVRLADRSAGSRSIAEKTIDSTQTSPIVATSRAGSSQHSARRPGTMIPPTSQPQRMFATEASQLVTSRIMYARGLDTKSRARSS